MPHLPTLSICVPSRNRQPWLQETVRALTASLRTDIELVFVDNSDDPAVMNAFIAPYLADPRVKYVPTGAEVRPMVDNWEVAFEATTGRWIVFIGDDDHVDPDLAGLIVRIEEKMPDVEALDWARLHFTWPYPGKPPHSNPVSLLTEMHEVPKTQLMERAFRWDHAREVLGCGFGIYHGAVSRKLMERIKVLSKTGRWFEHPVVDYDNIFKVIMHGRRFVHIRRPLSVMGVCPASNSAAVGKPEEMSERVDTFEKELKHPMDDMACYRTFPFRAKHGIASTIAMVHHWFAVEYGFDFAGYERNFARSCAIQCEKHVDRAQFDKTVSDYRAIFATWKGGKFRRAFAPEFKVRTETTHFSGWGNDMLFVSDAGLPCGTPADYYRFASGLIEKVEDLKVEPERHRVCATA
jgi:glycosyltransferase involved in cell wall biosynthesis